MSDNLVFLNDARLSFPHIADPQKRKNEQTGVERISYNGEFIMPENHPSYQKFMQVVMALATEKWKENTQAVLQLIMQDKRQRCFGNGNEKINGKTFKPYDGYAGNIYITAGRDQMPQIIRGDGSAVPGEALMEAQALARKMYGGCRVNAVVKPWIQDNKHGRGIRCDLVAIQFLRDDTAFGEGSTDASGMFGAVAATSQAAGMFGAALAQQPAIAPAMPGLPSFLGGAQ